MEEKELEGPVDKVTFETEKCGGCRSCELACSFHHMEIFQHSVSSLKIIGHNGPNPRMTFYRESVDGHIACDHCKGLDVPLCMEFCPPLGREELEKHFKAHMSAPKDPA